MSGYETWANLNVVFSVPKKYVSPQELQRLERVEVGKICRCKCKSCLCCEELRKELKG